MNYHTDHAWDNQTHSFQPTTTYSYEVEATTNGPIVYRVNGTVLPEGIKWDKPTIYSKG